PDRSGPRPDPHGARRDLGGIRSRRGRTEAALNRGCPRFTSGQASLPPSSSCHLVQHRHSSAAGSGGRIWCLPESSREPTFASVIDTYPQELHASRYARLSGASMLPDERRISVLELRAADQDATVRSSANAVARDVGMSTRSLL